MANDVMGSWKLKAKCRDLDDPEVMFPTNEDSGSPVDLREEAEAKAVCAGCPVVAPCLQWAIDSGQQFGVWGRRTTGERNAIRRNRSILAEQDVEGERELAERVR